MVAGILLVAACAGGTSRDSLAVSVVFSSTGGTVTKAGLFTAGPPTGSFQVVAAAGSVVGTASVSVTSRPAAVGAGVPLGMFNVPPSRLAAPIDLVIFAGEPARLGAQLATARRNRTRVIVNFAGGKYSNNFGPDGSFSYEVWKSRTDRFKGLDLAPYIADETLMANYLIDEPHNPDSWGGRAVPYATLERMAEYSKSLWPNLRTITRTRVTWLADAPFRWVYLDAGWAQYGVIRGDIYRFRDLEVAASKASGLAVLFGLNTTNGGAVVDGCYPGSRPGMCAMTASEIKRFGTVLASEPAGCGLTLWQYDEVYLGRSDIRSALAEVARLTKSRAPQPCT